MITEMCPGWHDVYVRNKSSYEGEPLRPFEGHHVAWSLEGHPIDHDADIMALTRRIAAMGFASDQVIYDYIPVGYVDSYS
ncbi:MAG: hypothetical protein K2W96_18735 [Gemmataceae bacterium]|nr:hypothetical protein [Gemmataceae bacterium]